MPISSAFKAALKKAAPDADFFVSDVGDALRLDKIVIPKEARGKGQGSAFMQVLTDEADRVGKPVVLTSAGDFGGSKSGQRRLFGRHGFVMNQGRNKDFRFTENMIRNPVDINADRLARAKAQGFDTQVFHGTRADDLTEFEPSDIGVHFGLTPDAANVRLSDTEAVRQGKNRFATRGSDFGENANVIPALTKAKNPLRMDDVGEWRDPAEVLSGLSQSHLPPELRRKADELAREAFDERDLFEDAILQGDEAAWFSSNEAQEFMDEARQIVKEGGHDSIIYNNFIESTGGGSDSLIVLDPEDIRSINAQFDPKKSGSSNILAGTAAAGVGASLLAPEEAEAAPMGTLLKKLGQKTRKAFHGSPHTFDRFDINKIGTGEGAQAYGHGLYFSSKKEIGEFYRNELRGPQRLRFKGQEVTPGVLNEGGRDTATNLVLRLMDDNRQDVVSGDLSGVRATLSQMADNPDWAISARRGLDRLDDIAKDVDFGDPGSLFTVEIPDESTMLDWDKPLSEQPEKVREALDSALADDAVYQAWKANGAMDAGAIRGREGYNRLVERFGDAPGGSRGAAGAQSALASESLQKLGIPGITYKGATSGERNFVIFDDELINIVERGFADPKILAPLAAAGAAAPFAISEVIGSDLGDRAALRTARGRMQIATKQSAQTIRNVVGGGEVAIDALASLLGEGLASAVTLAHVSKGPFIGSADVRRKVLDTLDYEPKTEEGKKFKSAAQDFLARQVAESPITQALMPTESAQALLREIGEAAEPVTDLLRDLPDDVKAVLESSLDLF